MISRIQQEMIEEFREGRHVEMADGRGADFGHSLGFAKECGTDL